MRTVSQDDLAKLQARGANVRALPVQPRKSEGSGDMLQGLTNMLQGLTDLAQNGVKKADLEAISSAVQQQASAAASEAAREADMKADAAVEAVAEIRQALEAVVAGVPAIARKEARKIVDNLPATKAEVVHHHPVIETREIVKPVHTVHTVERVVEEKSDPLVSMEVVRDRNHFITQVNTNKGAFSVKRNEAGWITGVVRA